MATQSFIEIVRETESIVGNIGLFMVEEQCRKVGKCSETLIKDDEPRLLMEILVVASPLTTSISTKPKRAAASMSLAVKAALPDMNGSRIKKAFSNCTGLAIRSATSTQRVNATLALPELQHATLALPWPPASALSSLVGACRSVLVAWVLGASTEFVQVCVCVCRR